MPPGPEDRNSGVPRRERHRERRRGMADDQHRHHALPLELLTDSLEQDGTETPILRQVYHHGLQADVETESARPARQVVLGNVHQGLVEGPTVALAAGRGGDREIEPTPQVGPQAALVLVAPHLTQKQDELYQDYLREIIFQSKIYHLCGSRLRGKRVLMGFYCVIPRDGLGPYT